MRVLVAGKLDADLATHLRERADLTVLELGPDGPQGDAADVVLYVVQDRRSLENDVTVLRSWTQAPIVLAVEGPADGLIDDALRLRVADVVVLPQSVESIAFALRKTSLAGPAADERDGTIITVFSPKGGTGKTVVASNLAVALHRMGLRTLLVDLDLQFGDGAMMLGVAPTVTIHDLAGDPGELDADKLEGFLTRHENGLALLAAPLKPEEAEGVNEQRIARVLKVAAAAFDAVVVDTSPQFDGALLAALEACDSILLVCPPEVTALKNVRVGLRTMQRLSIDLSRLSLVVNRAGMRGGLTVRDVGHALDRPVDFELPDDPAVSYALNRSVAVDRVDAESEFWRGITDLARSLRPAPLVEDGDRGRNGDGSLFARFARPGLRARSAGSVGSST